MKRFAAVPSASSEPGPASGSARASGREHPHRLPQLASLLQHELGILFARELELPSGVLLTVTKVTVTDDLSIAHVGVSVLPFVRRQEAFKLLAEFRRELQRLVNERLSTYRVPKLEFVIDESSERAATVESLLDSLR